MTGILLTAALVSLSVLVILRPLALGRPTSLTMVGSDVEARDRLLRQLRDLDNDLAAHKLDAADHARLREPVERAAADVLVNLSTAAAAQSAPAADRPASRGAGTRQAPGQRRANGSRLRTRLIALVAGAAVILGLGALLATSSTPRAPGATISGDAPPAERGSPGAGPAGSATGSGASAATPEQLAEVSAAEASVKRDPKDPEAHLALARAYEAAAAPQLATIEYLAVTQLDRANPEANAALALVALAAGQPEQGKKLVDTALAAHPGHPEALYARGLVQLMGLGQLAAGQRDLKAYLANAPFGSHRDTVETLLAMIPKGATK